ncbi:MAG: polysaccharide biosynthesis protein PslH [Acidimicrobiaceae bacterium]|nr:polysaccharide biosynthesis protein PslH [Acidimicrobiaceae bacterium]
MEIPLLVEHRVTPADLLRPGVVAAARGRSVPESMAWSRRRTLHALTTMRPDVVVCSTARAFHPDLLGGPWTLVIDYVDRLSDSYRDRSDIVGSSPTALLFRTLARTARRFERRPLPEGVAGIASGWDDAESLGLDWVPNTAELPPLAEHRSPTHDVLFLGKLSYLPNVEAIERLGRAWPAILERRPGTTLLLAGAAPERAVLDLARRRGWTVMADFADLATVMAAARVATAPLLHASGIQSKVLEAASFGLPQVIGRVVANGFGPGLPAVVVDDDEQLVEALVSILENPVERDRLGSAARDHVAAQYSVARWVPWATEVLTAAAMRRRGTT